MRKIREELRASACDAPGESWEAAIAGFLTERRAANRNASTLAHYRITLQVFRALMRRLDVATPRDLRRDHLEAWHDYLLNEYRVRVLARAGRRLAPTSVYAWFFTVVHLVRYLVRIEAILADPTAGLERPRYRRSRRRFIPTVAEIQRFLDTIRGPDVYVSRDRALFELLYSSGLRAGEAGGLDLYDLDLAASTVRVRGGKGGYDRVVPVGAAALKCLRHYVRFIRPEMWRPASGDALFIARYGGRLRTGVVDLRCRHWAARARLPLLTPHALRHAAATHMLAGGADIRQVQVFLGHHHITTTNWYTHVVAMDLVRAHRRSHPRG